MFILCVTIERGPTMKPKVIVYKKDGNVKEYNSVKEYMERNEFEAIEDNEKLPFD